MAVIRSIPIKSCNFASFVGANHLIIHDVGAHCVYMIDLVTGDQRLLIHIEGIESICLCDESYIVLKRRNELIMCTLSETMTPVYKTISIDVSFSLDVSGKYIWKHSGEVCKLTSGCEIAHIGDCSFIHGCNSFTVMGELYMMIAAFNNLYTRDIREPVKSMRLNCSEYITSFHLHACSSRITFCNRYTVFSCIAPICNKQEGHADLIEIVQYKDFLSNGYVLKDATLSCSMDKCCAIMHNIVNNTDVVICHTLP